jgi:glutamine synthetase adenylyltransferase
LLEITNSTQSIDPEQIITNKVTILEHLTVASITSNHVKDEILEEFNNSDKDIKFLTYKILMDKFNTKYDVLNNNQKQVLKEYINSVDNTPRLKEFYSNKINDIKSELITLNKKTKNQVTKIKINEIISVLQPPLKNAKVTDDNLIDLLQYYDLINELETVNG